MSWDISVMSSSSAPPPVEQMPSDWRGEFLGSQADIRQKISTVLPQVDWSDPTWGIFDGDGFSFEFNMGKDDPSDGFMIHVRGGGPAVAKLLELGASTGWFLLDCSQSEWLHHCKDPDAGWVGFQAYRDRVLATMSTNAKPGTPPNGGPVEPIGSSGVGGGLPSVSRSLAINTNMKPGLYKMCFRGLSLSEAWRFGGEPFKFTIALILKAIAFKGPICRLPSHHAERECNVSEIPSQEHFNFLKEVELALSLGYREGRFYTLAENHDPDSIDAYSYIALHDDMRRSLFIGSVRRKGANGVIHNLASTGSLRCHDSDDVEFMKHQFHFDSPPPSRRIMIKESGVIAIDKAMQNYMTLHETIKFPHFLALREHIKSITERVEASRVKRGLFVYEKEG